MVVPRVRNRYGILWLLIMMVLIAVVVESHGCRVISLTARKVHAQRSNPSFLICANATLGRVILQLQCQLHNPVPLRQSNRLHSPQLYQQRCQLELQANLLRWHQAYVLLLHHRHVNHRLLLAPVQQANPQRHYRRKSQLLLHPRQSRHTAVVLLVLIQFGTLQ